MAMQARASPSVGDRRFNFRKSCPFSRDPLKPEIVREKSRKDSVRLLQKGTGMKKSLFQRQGRTVLPAFRHFSRRAWLLHAVLIAGLIGMPFPRVVRADDYVRMDDESRVEVILSAPLGTSGMIPNATRGIKTLVRTHTWEVWVNSEGDIDPRNDEYVPMSDVSLSYVVLNGAGAAVSPASGSTNANGLHEESSFVMGTEAATIAVTAVWDDGDSTAEAQLNFDPPAPETWTFDPKDKQEYISAVLTADGPTDDVLHGRTRNLEVEVTYHSWRVERSNYGGTRDVGHSQTKAAGASLVWGVEGGGSGVISNATTTTNSQGKATARFTMEAAATAARVDVSYDGSQSTYATLSFLPPGGSGWRYDRAETVSGIANVSVNGSTTQLAAGNQRTISGMTVNHHYQVYVCDEDSSQPESWQYSHFDPVPYGWVEVGMISGGGTLQPSGSLQSGAGGVFSTIFTMAGTEPSEVGLYAEGDSEPDASITFTSNVETWDQTGTGSGKVITFATAAGQTEVSRLPGSETVLIATVYDSAWEIWESNWGGTETRNEQSTPATGQTVSFGLDYGNGVLTTTSAETDAYGEARVTLTMGEEDNRVRASILDGAGSIEAVVDVSVVPQNWWHDHDEATVTIAMSADGTTSNVGNGETRQISARITFVGWQIWLSNWGGYDRRSDGGGAASNAQATFTIAAGDGTVSSTSTLYADSNGDVSTGFTMGAQTSTVLLAVAYGATTAQADIGIHRPAPVWEHTGNGSELLVSLSEEAVSQPVIITLVRERRWEIGSRDTETEIRNVSIGPAVGAFVSYSITNGNGSLGSFSSVTGADAKHINSYSVEGSTGIWVDVSFNSNTAGAYISPTPYDPNADDDNDGLTNAQEWALGTDFRNSDTDGDGVGDWQEEQEGSDALLATSNSMAAVGLRVFTPLPAVSPYAVIP
jgi:hypothetical protein